MGVWGTGISSNDTYVDIYEEFIDLYNDGLSVEEITRKIINENQETITISEDAPNFWFAIANAQWECCGLNEEVFAKVENIILSGEDICIWTELGSTSADIKTRQKVLNKFLDKLRTNNGKPRKRTKKKFYDSIFKKGDCIVYVMDNGHYGGALVLTEELNTEAGVNYIAITTIDKKQKPELNDFKNAEVYVTKFKDTIIKNNTISFKWIDLPQIGGFSAYSYKKGVIDIEVVANINIYKRYIINRQLGFGWTSLKTKIPFRYEYIKLNGAPKLKVKLSKWISKNWLKRMF
ncbi:MAG: hypothetical protein EOP46_03100 [Sphingobacteriaceae bacterium]|nr:MAG: hypothetical protein EOP46_03100 [Sphingobacteriaceae bacterium]